MLSSSYSNPYLRTSSFQQRYPTLAGPSCTSLFTPSMSICPRKKYSQQYWYDMRSSNPQLSEKVLYRMNAHYHKLQAMGDNYQDQQHCKSCLIGCQERKNPFSKTSLLDSSRLARKQLQKEPGYHWTDKKDEVKFTQPNMYRDYADTLKQYANLRIKITNAKQKQGAYPNTALALQNYQQATFGGSQKMISDTLRRQVFANLPRSQRGIQSKRSNQIQRMDSLGQLSKADSKETLSMQKQSSSETFRIRSQNLFPKNITYQNKQYFLTVLSPYDQSK